ncbi:MAG: nucleotidyltransferase family protein, partial [Gemmatimonadaceae bacterium]
VTFVYAGLFGTGSFIYGKTTQASVWVVVFVVSGLVLFRVVQRAWSVDPELVGSETSALAGAMPCTKAVILARGLGTRMREGDDSVALAPDQRAAAAAGDKAMIPVGRPFLDYVLNGLADAGFTEICIVVAPEHSAIRDHYSHERSPLRFKISYVVQAEPIGTADAVLAAEEFSAGEPFVVLNADNYYPADVLRRLRNAPGTAGVAFSRQGLIRNGDIPVERVAAYAFLDINDDGTLRRIVEKPDATVAATYGADAVVSMNCWRLTSDIFRACREVPASSRGEFELPVAIQYAIDILGTRITMVPADASVLDLSRQGDVPRVAARLSSVEVRL